MSTSKNRRLAAILFADIVGYTALMQADEPQALTSLQKFKTALEKQVPANKGAIIQFYGDGCLAIFDSSVDAVTCAKNLQFAFQTAPTVPVRIGLHAGDVVFRDDNVFGDAVNIASRIESMGVPGAVLLSSSVRNQIKNQPALELMSLGRFEFKNVAEGMTVYALANEELIIPLPEVLGGKQKIKPKDTQSAKSKAWMLGLVVVILLVLVGRLMKQHLANSTVVNREPTTMPNYQKSIAVLPFKNRSNDPEQAYFSDGMSEEILNALTQIKDLKVSGRSSSFQFREEQVNIKEVGEKLGVTTVLEGSVWKVDDRVRIIAQLTNINDGFQLWSGRFEREIKDVFSIQDEIAKAIVKNLELTFAEKGKKHLVKAPTQNQEAYDLYLKAMQYRDLFQPQKAIELLEQAIQLDSQFALAYADLSILYYDLNFPLLTILDPAIEKKVRTLANRAIELDSTLPEAYSALVYIYQDYDYDYRKAQKTIEKALELEETPRLYYNLAHNIFHQNGDKKQATAYMRKAVELDPLNILWYQELATIYAFTRKERELRDLLVEVNELFSGDIRAVSLSVYIKFRLSEYEDAYKDMQTVLSINDFLATATNLTYVFYIPICAYAGKESEARSALKEFETNPERAASPYFFAACYLSLGEKEKTYEQLELAFERKDILALRQLRFEPRWDALRGEPRFEELLERLEVKD